jgi:hypothetical protein
VDDGPVVWDCAVMVYEFDHVELFTSYSAECHVL